MGVRGMSSSRAWFGIALASGPGLLDWQVPTLPAFAEPGPESWSPLPPGQLSAMGLHYCPQTGRLSSASVVQSSIQQAAFSRGALVPLSDLSIGTAKDNGRTSSSSIGSKHARKTQLKKKPLKTRQDIIGDLNDTSGGFLRRGKVKTAKGRQNYLTGSEDFRRWAASTQRLDVASAAAEVVDKLLETYVEKIFLANDGIFAARSAVYGEAWRRGWNLQDVRMLELSRGSLAGWSNLCPDQSKEPMPWLVCALLAEDLFLQKRKVDAEASECLLVQFDAYLRPDTACSLADFNVVPPPSDAPDRYRQFALILCPSSQGSSTTKTGGQDDSLLLGPNPNRKFSGCLVGRVHARCLRRGGGALWPLLNLPVFERLIRQSAARVGLQHLRIAPHLARHGGISTDVFEEVLSLGDAKKRGKWTSDASVRRYEKHARLIAVLNKLSPQQRRDAQTAASRIGKLATTHRLLDD